jgi:hypothetical protein
MSSTVVVASGATQRGLVREVPDLGDCRESGADVAKLLVAVGAVFEHDEAGVHVVTAIAVPRQHHGPFHRPDCKITIPRKTSATTAQAHATKASAA